MSEALSSPTPSIAEELEKLAGERFVYVGEIEFPSIENPADRLLALVVKDPHASRGQVPWSINMANAEPTIIGELVEIGVLPPPKKADQTHEKHGVLYFGRFSFAKHGEQYEIAFFPSEENARERMEYLKTLLKNNPLSVTEGRLSMILSVHRSVWRSLFKQK